MFTSCWSVKGGAGTSVVAAALALLLARSRSEALLVDVAGDAPAVLGVPEPTGPGLVDWLAAGPAVPADGLARLEVPTRGGVAIVPRGRGDLVATAHAEVLAAVLAGDSRPVVVDCGRVVPGEAELARVLAASATRSFLVIRTCYLSLRRAASAPLRPSGLVVVHEAGRVLDVGDVEDVACADALATLPCDPAVARAVDAGELARRLPRSLARGLAPLVAP